MFTEPRPNLYESADGFSVEVLGQTGIRYRQGDRQMFVDSEVLAGPAGMAIYRDSVSRWDPPHDKDTISAAEREKIVSNIRDAFRFKGFEIHVI